MASNDVTCTHHFKIDPPRERTSMGMCSKCGETREMVNSVEPDPKIPETLQERRKRFARNFRLGKSE